MFLGYGPGYFGSFSSTEYRRVTLVQTSKVRTDPARFISANYVARVFNNTPIILHFT